MPELTVGPTLLGVACLCAIYRDWGNAMSESDEGKRPTTPKWWTGIALLCILAPLGILSYPYEEAFSTKLVGPYDYTSLLGWLGALAITLCAWDDLDTKGHWLAVVLWIVGLAVLVVGYLRY